MELSDDDPGRRLRQVRERFGLRYRDVAEATQIIANARGSQEYSVGLSRLADIENKGTVPSIYRIYSLCAVYGLRVQTVMDWYGVPLERLPADTLRITHRRTRTIEGDAKQATPAELPLPPAGTDFARTTFIGRQLQKWGTYSVAALGERSTSGLYAVIGSDDWSMFPLLYPGTFVQVDDRRRKPQPGPWAHEAERPIYLVERREGFRCGWCLQRGRTLTVEYHPLSGLQPESFLSPNEGEVVGQIVALAMRLDSAKRRRTRS